MLSDEERREAALEAELAALRQGLALQSLDTDRVRRELVAMSGEGLCCGSS